MSEQPATDIGTTAPAGEGLGDEELSTQVSEQTANDRIAEDAVFEQEADGAKSDQEAAKGGA